MRSVLLVEDDADHAELFRRAFLDADSPLELRIVGTLQAARAALAEDLPDVLVTDLVLPDGRGTELLEDGLGARLPILILTSFGDESIAVGALRSGAIDYIVKPASTFEELPRRAIHAWRDFQERRERQRLQDELDQFFRLADSVMCVLTEAGNVLRANPALTQILGWSEAELRARSLFDLMATEERASLEPQFHALTTTPLQFSVGMQTSTGGTRQLEWSLSRGAQAGQIYATAIDITLQHEEHARAQRREVAAAKLTVLSSRERQVLQGVIDGLPNKAIAAQLELNEKTIEKHRARLMRKLKCRTLPALVQLVVLARGD